MTDDDVLQRASYLCFEGSDRPTKRSSDLFYASRNSRALNVGNNCQLSDQSVGAFPVLQPRSKSTH